MDGTFLSSAPRDQGLEIEMSNTYQPRPQSELFAALSGQQFTHSVGGHTGTYTIRIESGAHVVADRLRGPSVMAHQRAVAETVSPEGWKSLIDLSADPALFVRLCNELAGGYYRV